MTFNDLSHLPKAEKPRNEGLAPDASPRFVQALVERWAEDDGHKDRAFDDTRFRHSDAGKCSRAIAYAALDLPGEPMDLSGVWNTRLGTLIHEKWQEVIAERFPDADIEPKLRSDAGSGHADAVITTTNDRCNCGHGGEDHNKWWDIGGAESNGGPSSGMGCDVCECDDVSFVPSKTTLFELKTIGGFAFKMAVGERGAAQGPKFEHIVQSALNGAAVDADEIVIGYMSKEAISVAAASKKGFDELGRFVAEWTFSREQYEPIANAEIERVTGILDLLDEGTLPKRCVPGGELPAGAEITDPTKGQWTVVRDGVIVDLGTFWGCGYCKYRTICATTEPGRVSVKSVQVAA